MLKKLTMYCLALTALAAFSTPSSSSAANNPQLTHPTGTVIPIGTKVTATNVGETELQTTVGTTIQKCTSAAMTMELTRNAAGNVMSNVTSALVSGTGAGGACTGIFTEKYSFDGLPWCLRSDNTMGEDEFQVYGGACSEAAKKVTLKLTGTANCKYESTTTTFVKGTVTTDSPATQDAGLQVPRTGHTPTEDAGLIKVEGGIACPSSGALRIAFTLETDSAAAEPIYIS